MLNSYSSTVLRVLQIVLTTNLQYLYVCESVPLCILIRSSV